MSSYKSTGEVRVLTAGLSKKGRLEFLRVGDTIPKSGINAPKKGAKYLGWVP